MRVNVTAAPIVHSLGVDVISRQLRNGFDRNEGRKFLKLFRDVETELGRAGDQTRLGKLRHRGEQFRERSRTQKIFAAASRNARPSVSVSSSLAASSNASVAAALREGIGGGVADRPVTSATAKIAAELFVELRAGLEILAVVAFEKRHDETGRAVAALRSEIFHHRLLHGMRICRMPTPSTVTMSRPAMSGSGTRQLLIDAITTFAARIAIDNRDRTGAAIAFGTAFLRTSQAVRLAANRAGSTFGETPSIWTGLPFSRNSIASAHLFPPTLRGFCRNERERNLSIVSPVASASASGDRAAGDAAQEKIEQPLPGRGIIEDVAEKRSERGFFDKSFQPVGCAVQTFEEK